MMNKKYLMNGFAALALIASVSSCTKDVTTMSQSEIDSKAKENAELQLGFTIPDGQSWVMASQVTADISVNLGLDQEYTVGIYDKNPLYDSSAKFFVMETVKEGEALSTSFSLPTSLDQVYVATYDSKNRSVVNTVDVENGQIVANIGGSMMRSGRRAVEDASVYPDYVKTLNNYLNPAAPNNYTTVKNISVSDMQAYTAITEADIAQTGTTLTNRYYYNLYDENGNYIKNTSSFPGDSDGKHYRIASDTEITSKIEVNGTENVINDVVIYVEGKLHLNGNTLNGPTIVVAPDGELVIDGTTNMSKAGRIIVMAGGKISGAEGVAYNVNNGGQCYNAGTIEFDGELNVNGSDFYNNGTIIVDVLRNTSGGKFTNFGKITARTNTGAGDSYNSTIINGCYMHFTENAGIGTLTLLDNSRLDVDGRAEFNQATQTLYNQSEINVGELYVTSTTFSGPTAQGSYAIVKTGKIFIGRSGDVTTQNNVYFDWDTNEAYHKSNGKYTDGQTNVYSEAYWLIHNQITKYTSENSSTLIIPKGDCTGMGYNPGGGGGKINGDPAVYTYAFEDQTVNTDYDMNDVVLKVNYHVTEQGTGANAGKVIYDKTKLDVKLVAAGATFNIKVKIGDTYLFGGKEIHDALNVDPGVMVNTGGPQTANPAVEKNGISIPAGWNGDFTKLPVSIEVLSTSTTYVFPNTDLYPHAVMVPTDWAWPQERVNVQVAYPGTSSASKVTINNVEVPNNSFRAWGGTPAASRTSAMNGWYNNPASGKVVSNN